MPRRKHVQRDTGDGEETSTQSSLLPQGTPGTVPEPPPGQTPSETPQTAASDAPDDWSPFFIKGGFSYSGQRCTAVKIVMVMNEVRALGGRDFHPRTASWSWAGHC